jgi:hypothetical protein
MHFVANEEDVIETILEEELSVDGVDYRSRYKEF